MQRDYFKSKDRVMKKGKILILIVTAVVLLGAGCFLLSRKLTYLENAYFSFASDDVISVDTIGTELRESFVMPYDAIRAITVKIGNYQRDSNSKWEMILEDKNGNEIYSKKFGFLDAMDEQYYTIELGGFINVNKGEQYTVTFRAIDISDGNKIGFYWNGEKNIYSEKSELYHEGEYMEGTLCMTIQGGDTDWFWYAVYVLFAVICIVLILRVCYLAEKGLNWKEDKFVWAILTGIIVFFLYFPYAKTTGNFTDENDNVRGGMIIARGGILYKDYVTQHTPAAYYLCAIFSLLGASSVEQMRILFYFLLAVVWTLIFLRYEKMYGKKAMLLLPVFVILCTRVIIGTRAIMLLSDVIQGMAMIILFLEFLMYLKDKCIGWLRSIIISFGIWAAFGSVFMSAYEICILVFGFLLAEFFYWKSNRLHVRDIFSRYGSLLVIGMIPPVAGIIYLKLNHALYYCYEEAYLFNREVYTKYQSVGKSLVEPFLSGLSSVLDQFVGSILAFGNDTSLTAYHVALIFLVTIYICYITKSMFSEKKNIWYYGYITLFICTGATRGVDSFHAYAFWGLLSAFVLLFPLREGMCILKDTKHRKTIYEFRMKWVQMRIAINKGFRNIIIAIGTIGICFIIQPYISTVVSAISSETGAVSYNDSYIVAVTKDNEGIFIDAYCNDSIYLIAKGRYPVNRAVYCLPWYMDWYEEWNIADLTSKSPQIAVWNPSQTCWNRSGYAMKLNDYINENYIRVGEDSIIWEKIGK